MSRMYMSFSLRNHIRQNIYIILYTSPSGRWGPDGRDAGGRKMSFITVAQVSSRWLFDAEPCRESTDNICIKSHSTCCTAGASGDKTVEQHQVWAVTFHVCRWRVVDEGCGGDGDLVFIAARELSWRQIKGVVDVRVYLASAQRTELCVCVCVNSHYLLTEEQWEVQSCGSTWGRV